MKIPTREECQRLLSKYNFPKKKRKHIEKVTEVAVFLGKRLKERGEKVDIDLVRAGGLLHDLDKGIRGAGKVHPLKAVEILKALGYPEVARICETHTINSFLDLKTIPTTWEEKCVALADKMAKDEVVGVEERFRRWREEEKAELNKIKLRKAKIKSKAENKIFEKNIKKWKRQLQILKKSYLKVKQIQEEVFKFTGTSEEEIRKLFPPKLKKW